MTNEEKLKEIELIVQCIPKSGASYQKDAEWLISRVKVLTEALWHISHITDEIEVKKICIKVKNNSGDK